jgi:hypothetical protein
VQGSQLRVSDMSYQTDALAKEARSLVKELILLVQEIRAKLR